MSGRVARIVLCAAGPLENWLSPPCSAWWIQSSEKMSAASLCIASSAADFVPRAGCTPPGSTSCCTRTIRWPNELFDSSRRSATASPEQALVLLDRVVRDREAAHDHETAAGDELLVDLAGRAVDVGMADVLARDRVARQVARPHEELLEPGDGRGCEAVDEVVVAGEVGARPTPSGRAPARCGSRAHDPPSDGIVRSRAACAPAASDMNPASVPALTKRRPELDELGEQLEVADAGDAEHRVVRATRLGHGAHRVEERLVAELAEDAHLRGEVVRAHHDHVDARRPTRSRRRWRSRRASRASPPPWSGRRRSRAARVAASAGSGWPRSVPRPTGGPAAGTGTRRRSARPRRAVSTCGTITPIAPMSSDRVRYWWSCDGTRTSGVMPAPIAPEHSSDVGLERGGGVLEVDVHRVVPAAAASHRDVGGAGLGERHAEHELPGVDPLAQRGHALHHWPRLVARRDLDAAQGVLEDLGVALVGQAPDPGHGVDVGRLGPQRGRRALLLRAGRERVELVVAHRVLVRDLRRPASSVEAGEQLARAARARSATSCRSAGSRTPSTRCRR